MSPRDFDTVIIGARCAGAPTAMLLARKGYKVLCVDRATFPSETLSTHVIQPHGVARLARWGVLDRVVASGCPAIHTYAYYFGLLAITGLPGTADAPVAYCPRRRAHGRRRRLASLAVRSQEARSRKGVPVAVRSGARVSRAHRLGAFGVDPPPPDMMELLGAAAGNQEAMDRFCRVIAGTSPPDEFFSEENARRIRAGS